MPLESARRLLESAVAGGYALGYFESWNLESLQGVIDAAEGTRSPIIIGFNGDFLSRPDRLTRERLAWYGALGLAAARSATVPCALIFNECPADDWILEAVSCGFNLVMPADPKSAFEHYRDRVAALTRLAHEHDVDVEAEVGELPSGVPGHGSGHGTGSTTDPDQAAEFVEATGVDLLAVSVGNVHIKLDGTQELDLRRLDAIRRRVAVPLVLHGGTGISDGSLREAIALGVAKVNFGTYLKRRYLDSVRATLGRRCDDPHRLLGIGGVEDVLVAGRMAVRDAVLERIERLGCCGRA